MTYEYLQMGARYLNLMNEQAQDHASFMNVWSTANLWHLQKIMAKQDVMIAASELGKPDMTEQSRIANLDNYQMIEEITSGQDVFKDRSLEGINGAVDPMADDFYQSEFFAYVPVTFPGIEGDFTIGLSGTTWEPYTSVDGMSHRVDVQISPGVDDESPDYHQVLDPDDIGDSSVECLEPASALSGSVRANLLMCGEDIASLSTVDLRSFCVEALALNQTLLSVKQAKQISVGS